MAVMQRRRLLVLASTYPARAGDGTPAFVRDLAAAESSRYETTVLVPSVPGSVGDFYWSGVHGTYFWVDPREQLVGVLMLCSPDLRRHYRAMMRQLTYQSIID